MDLLLTSKLLYMKFLAIFFLGSFISFLKPINQEDTFLSKLNLAEQGSCAAPTSLQGELNGTNLKLTRNGVSGVTQYSYGGYLNPRGTFGGTTGGTQITITVPSGTTSGTFRITSLCSDGSSTTSAPQSF